MIPSYGPQRETPSGPEIHIEDVIVVDSGEVMLLVRVPATSNSPVAKDKLQCRFGDLYRFAFTTPLALHTLREDRAAVLCAPPPRELTWDGTTVMLIELDQVQEVRPVAISERQLIQWNATNLVVYDSFATEHDVVVFVHGASSPRESSLSPDAELARLQKFRCVFNGEVETAVTSQAQEIFRCAHPPEGMILARKKMTVKYDGRLLPSLAYYNPELTAPSPSTATQQQHRHDICACTMIYNGAKFLSEWVHYNSHLGVTKFFLYDNNSEDDLEETIAQLDRFNISKQPWPWVKTQNAGFSHCSLLTRSECDWMLFLDVDEYFFFSENPKSPKNETHPPLATLITDAVMKNSSRSLGQITTACYDFGPSGLTISPPQGLTQGYTCRVKKPDRHKSIVRLCAVADSLQNSIHHFSLRDGYATEATAFAVGVVNHYKFQVWDEFKVKFRRRAATWVADWTENPKRTPQDRVPDLGVRAEKPEDWERRYCEVWDYGLRNYTRSVFGKDEVVLPWEKPCL